MDGHNVCIPIGEATLLIDERMKNMDDITTEDFHTYEKASSFPPTFHHAKLVERPSRNRSRYVGKRAHVDADTMNAWVNLDEPERSSGMLTIDGDRSFFEVKRGLRHVPKFVASSIRPAYGTVIDSVCSMQ